MAKQCGKCGFTMGTFQEVTTFSVNLLASAAAAGLIGATIGGFFDAASSGSRGLTAGFDNTLLKGRATCPSCDAQGRWIDR